MVDRTEYERWREAAADARKAANVQAGAEQHNWACFLAEQSAQLAAKALLHGIGAGAWGHDLVELGRTIEEHAGEPLSDAVHAALQRLSRHYIPARYPDAHPSGAPAGHYGPEASRQALEDLAAILDQIDDLWRRLAAAGDEQ